MRNTKTNMQFWLGKLGNTLLEKRQLGRDVQRAKKQALQKYEGVPPQAGRVDQTRFLQPSTSGKTARRTWRLEQRWGRFEQMGLESRCGKGRHQIKSLQWFENEKPLRTFHSDCVSHGFSYYSEKKQGRRKHKNSSEETLPKARASLDKNNQCGQGDRPMIHSEDSQHLQGFVLNNWKPEVTIKWFRYS